MPRPLLPLLTLLLLTLSRPTYAVIVQAPPPTLGTLVATASTILRGNVSHIDGNDVTIDVLETLYGTPYTNIIVRADDPTAYLSPTPAQNALLFLTNPTPAPDPTHPIPTFADKLHYSVSHTLHRTDKPALTDDLHLLTTPDEQIAEVRRLISLRPLQLATFPPPDYLFYNLNLPWASWLTLAITPESLALAHTWLLSPDPDTQWAGAEILARHPSPDSAATLLRFAQSPPITRTYDEASRANLLALLATWHATPLPSLIPAAPVLTLPNVLSLAALACVAALFLFTPPRHRPRPTTLLLQLLVTTLILFILRSYTPRDALAITNTDLVIDHADLYIIHHPPPVLALPTPIFRYALPGELNLARYLATRDPTPDSLAQWPSDTSIPASVMALPYANNLRPHSNITLLPILHGPTYRISLYPFLLILLPLLHRLYKHLRTRTAPAFPITPT